MATDYFAGSVARAYDQASADMFEPAVVEPAVQYLAGLAGSGRVLELGIGTGRLALPLCRRGISVHGIDLSQDMVQILRSKRDAERIDVTVGDFARVRVPGFFHLAYVVFNTFMNLTTQEDQVACFANVARHLSPGGRFVIEVSVPDLRRLPPGESIKPFRMEPDRLGFDEYDTVTQRMHSHHYRVLDDRLERVSIPFRYVWPSELDLMGRLAGFELQDRLGDWDERPFCAESSKHVSVWKKR